MIERQVSIDEKRRYSRVETHVPVNYKNLKKLKDDSTQVLTNDIGEGGLRFRSNEFVSLACRLLLEINLPTTSRAVKAISKVAWIRKKPESREYEIGNQFLEISKEDREHIISFVNKLISPSM